MNSIAIVSWGAMADVLYATPIVRHIRKLNPEAKISWLIRDKFAEVVDTNPDINEVVNFILPEGYSSRQEAEYVMDRDILDFAHKHYAKVYDLQYWPRYSNFYQNPSEDFISLRARNAGLNPLDIKDRSIVLHPSDEDRRAVIDYIHQNFLFAYRKFITVNHISYAASAVWSFKDYELLVDALSKRNIKAVFTGAKNEPLPEKAIDARGMPYRQWMNLIAISNLWLGLDSGAVALACATKTPIIKFHSRDFPLAKTGIKAMGLRTNDVLELCPAPNVGAVVDLIEEMINERDRCPN